ncbi:MAG: dihydrofolate reductase family protein [Solirubrobacteraceae bacterium]|nr:dihydrofolate reductase family protein [Solirubrobacteraceae bacterium]
MAKLIYSMFTSLDGYITDADGKLDWAAPDAEVHAFANELSRPVGTHLYGRRFYETMAFWETDDATASGDPVMVDFATSWRAADKVVYSTTLAAPMSARTRIERAFDIDEVRRLKAAQDGDLAIAGAGLAAGAFRAGLVDEIHLFLMPVIVGGGTPALPGDLRVDLELLDERRFASGAVYVRHSVRS